MKKQGRKKRDGALRQGQRRLDQKRRLEHVLTALGVLAGLRGLPAWAREAALGVQALDVRRLQTDEGAFPFNDFVTVCWALPDIFSFLAAPPLPKKYRLFLDEAATRAAAFREEYRGDMEHHLTTELFVALLRRSRVEQAVYGGVMEEQQNEAGRPRIRLRLIRSEPREVRVAVDGKERPAFQCGLPNWLEGVRWAEADGGQFGLDGGLKYPVFIQSHALRKLKERFPADAEVDVITQYGLLDSLTDRKVVERQGDASLIAYHLHELRVGYLVARAVEDRIVIVTFLFLTMQGTPESRLLRQELPLCRRDVEHLGLDRLETFLGPDVLQDEGLVKVLEGCGCGPLLELARKGFPCDALTGRAEELRRFLRVEDGGGQRRPRRGGPPWHRSS